jgi:hypothetical protein
VQPVAAPLPAQPSTTAPQANITATRVQSQPVPTTPTKQITPLPVQRSQSAVGPSLESKAAPETPRLSALQFTKSSTEPFGLAQLPANPRSGSRSYRTPPSSTASSQSAHSPERPRLASRSARPDVPAPISPYTAMISPPPPPAREPSSRRRSGPQSP